MASLEHGAVGSCPAVDGNQAISFRVRLTQNRGMPVAGIQPLDESREQGRAAAVDAIEMRQVDVHRTMPLQARFGLRQGPLHRGGVSQIERTGRHDPHVVAVPIDTDLDAHRCQPPVPWAWLASSNGRH